ncbi:hypothetical protein IMCC20628_02639 [Hoeflea sp. IMCC20628]|uniref:CBU_0592 family membrane protein n=1 Tax=Hoeflea sp. IMCC20628 TaxID=1620421 RepID=UPI00063AE6AC|nr:hypothetical protein [Hoeflea sp. IMCC20628]AKI01336.1 hypothetical protein IMCC20628_02639 [Hoeflea sp. IMCC20628]
MSDLFDTMRAYPDLLSASGVVGSIIYISGFALVQSGRTCGNGPLYSASKVIAAILVLISLVGAFNLGAFIIQVGFITFGLVGLGRQFSSKRDETVGPRPFHDEQPEPCLEIQRDTAPHSFRLAS